MGRSILRILFLVGIVFSAFVATGGIVMADQPPAKAPVLAGTDLTVTKSDTLFNDANGDGVPSPGDTLRYEIIIVNLTAAAATDVIFNDTPDGNTTLVVGSVTTTLGAITSGNGAGDTSVSVNIGTIAGLGVVVVHFSVTINDPLPPGVSHVTNQGVVSGSNFPDEPSDDPDEPGPDNPTDTPITGPIPVGGELSVVDREAVLRANAGLLILPLAAVVIIIGIIGLVAIRRRPSA